MNIKYHGNIIADKAGFKNGTYRTNITENDNNSITVLAPLYDTSKTSLGVYCSNCSDCHNQVDVALEPNVCSSADLTVTILGADSKILVQ